jgi:hypothetical protein
MSQVTTGPRHVKSVGGITLDKVYVAEFQKPGTKTAQIRQVITTDSYYPSKQTSTDMQSNIFGNAEFGFEEQHFQNKENRVAWIPVPVNATEDQIKVKLAEIMSKGACIYRVLSNHPILDAHQQYAVNTGLNGVTLNTFANSQVLRFPKGHAQEGQISLSANNKVVYRRTFFWHEPKADSDLRTTDPADVYVSPEIALELAGKGIAATDAATEELVLAGQGQEL